MPKRILVFSSVAPSNGGVPSMTADMVDALVGSGHEVSVAYPRCARGIRLKWESSRDYGVQSFALKSCRQMFIGMQTIHWGAEWRQFVDSYDAAIVVCGSPYIGIPFLNTKTPVYVWAAVTMREDQKGRFESFGFVKQLAYRLALPQVYRQERRVIRDCDHLWALSDESMHDFLCESGRDSRATVLLPPIDTEYFRPSEKEADAPTVLFTGRYNDPRKDVHVLLKAIATLRTKVPGVRLKMVGEDAPSQSVVDILRELSLEDTVELLPSLERHLLLEHYQAAQVFVIPSRQEGLCISGLEAMACGLPVVSTRCGGPATYIQDGATGYLVPVGDDQAIAFRLQQLLSDTDGRRTFSRNSREQIIQRCGMDSFRATVDQVINKSNTNGQTLKRQQLQESIS